MGLRTRESGPVAAPQEPRFSGRRLARLIRAAWWVPALLSLPILLLVLSLAPSSTLLEAFDRPGLTVSCNEYVFRPVSDAAASFSRVSFRYRPRDHEMLYLRFNVADDGFDGVRLSGIDEFPSEVFSFGDGRPIPLQTLPIGDETGAIEFDVACDDGALVVRAGGAVVGTARVGGCRGPLLLATHQGYPVHVRPPVRDLGVARPGVDGSEAVFEDAPDRARLARIVGSTLAVDAALAALVALLLWAAGPRALTAARARSASAVLAVFLALAALTFMIRVLVPRWMLEGAWYAPYLVDGRLEDARIPSDAVIQNGNDAFLVARPAGAVRIVFLGGSSTWGTPFAPGDPETTVSRTARALRDRNPGLSDALEVVNLGRPSESFTRHIKATYDFALRRMSPDVVVVNAVYNNYVEYQNLGNMFECFVFRGLRGRDLAGSDTRAYRDDLRWFARRAREAGARLLFIEEPVLRDFTYGRDFLSPFYDALRETSAAENVELVTAQEDFDRHRDRFLFYDFVHLTYWGQRRLAERIAGAIDTPEFKTSLRAASGNP